MEIKRRCAAISKAQRKAIAANEELTELMMSLALLNQPPSTQLSKEPSSAMSHQSSAELLLDQDLEASVTTSSVSERLIMVTSNDLGEVLAMMSISDVPVIFDFQGRRMEFTENGDPTVCSGSQTWRNGEIILTDEQQLNISGGRLVLDTITIIGGILGLSIRETGEVVMSECKIQRSRMFGLYVDGAGKLTASGLELMYCRTSVQLHGTSSANIVDCEISGGDEGVSMYEDSSMVGTRINFHNIAEQVLYMQDHAHLSLTDSKLNNNLQSPGVIYDTASLQLKRCVVHGDFQIHSPATVVVSD